MARASYSGITESEERLGRLGRDGIRRIVEAGSNAARARMTALTAQTHRRTGDLAASVRPGKLYEGYRSASQEVDFSGNHGAGITNHDLAYILDNGRPGDGFITRQEKRIDQDVAEAMQAESDRIMAEADAE